ncbi:MAG: AraC family transcriptional regulator [Akkermansiaceae bacterium]|jgi:AraC family transcriptional regulator of arabinose operon|nr:AraC family transcriptional regulator [Akkermansiaceae bacterium]
MIIAAGRSITPAGEQMEREPGFPHWTAGFLIAGSIEIALTGGRTIQLESHACVIIPPNTPYELTVKKQQDQVWMIFDPRMHLQEGLRPLNQDFETFAVAFEDSETWTAVRAGLHDLVRWWGATPPHLLLAENAMVKVLLLARWEYDQQHHSTPDERIGRVVDIINNRLGEELSVETLAEEAGLSPSRFAHLFRERMGVTPMNFLESRRMEQARQLLLTTDLPVQEVALNIGFPNAQHFSTRFRKITGQSPSAFRKIPRRRFGELYPEEEEPPRHEP